MLEAVAIARGLPAEKGRELYAAWVEKTRPAGCPCETCGVVRRAHEIEQSRLEVGGSRGPDGFWIFPNGLPDEDRTGPYQVAEGVWVHREQGGSREPV